MEPELRHLPIPDPVLKDSQAIELLRVWAARGGQHVSLAAEIWPDPRAWGVFLVDLAKHVANAYEQTTSINRTDALRRLKEGFDVEWATETDRPSGQVVD